MAVVDILVTIVEAIVAAISQLEEVAVLHIAKWFGPSNSTVHAIGPSVVFDELAYVFVGSFFVVVFVECARVVVFVHIAVIIAYLGAEATTFALLELVVIHKLTAKFVA